MFLCATAALTFALATAGVVGLGVKQIAIIN